MFGSWCEIFSADPEREDRDRATKPSRRLVPPLPPCFEHQYQNKGLTGAHRAMNIILKDLAVYQSLNDVL
jgi:hypothetical protein